MTTEALTAIKAAPTSVQIKAFHDAYDASLEMQPRETAQAIYDGLCAALSQSQTVGTPAPEAHMDLSLAASDVLFERQRQVSSEGWTVEHDDAHASEELATAASCYLRPDLRTVTVSADRVTFGDPWPWWNEWNDGGRCAGREKAWWKPTDRRRDLVKAAALIIAEIERIDRAALAATTEGQP